MSNYGKCPACGKWVPKGDVECPHCGEEQSTLAYLRAFWATLFPARSKRRSGRLCVACDRLVGVEDATCPHCGVAQTGARKAARAVSDALPSTVNVTQLVLGVMGVLFVIPILAMTDLPDFSTGSYLSNGDHMALILMGANFGPLLESGEYWRLVTATFLHIGAMHIIFNGYALHVLGHPLEELYGRGWFFFMYVVTGIVGNLLSWGAHGIEFANAGASGSIFGLIGMGIAHCWRHRWVNRQLLRLLITWAVFGLAFGFFFGADNWAHVGGLVSGAGLAWALRAEVVAKRQLRKLGDVLGILTALAVIACFVLAVLAAPELKEAIMNQR
jgi:rhomboid protease GluP